MSSVVCVRACPVSFRVSRPPPPRGSSGTWLPDEICDRMSLAAVLFAAAVPVFVVPQTPHARASSITMGWSDPNWNWGSAIGDAHDEAMKVRKALSTPEARVKFLQDTSSGAAGLDEAKMALALSCQRARNLGYDTDAGIRDGGRWPTGGKWEALMNEMAECAFEGDGGDEALSEAIRMRLKASAQYPGEPPSVMICVALQQLDFVPRGL